MRYAVFTVSVTVLMRTNSLGAVTGCSSIPLSGSRIPGLGPGVEGSKVLPATSSDTFSSESLSQIIVTLQAASSSLLGGVQLGNNGVELLYRPDEILISTNGKTFHVFFHYVHGSSKYFRQMLLKCCRICPIYSSKVIFEYLPCPFNSVTCTHNNFARLNISI